MEAGISWHSKLSQPYNDNVFSSREGHMVCGRWKQEALDKGERRSGWFEISLDLFMLLQ